MWFFIEVFTFATWNGKISISLSSKFSIGSMDADGRSFFLLSYSNKRMGKQKKTFQRNDGMNSTKTEDTIFLFSSWQSTHNLCTCYSGYLFIPCAPPLLIATIRRFILFSMIFLHLTFLLFFVYRSLFASLCALWTNLNFNSYLFLLDIKWIKEL